MKAECVQEVLKNAVSHAEKISGKNPSLPVLACIVIEAVKNQLHIKSTNLDLWFHCVIPAKVEEEGVIAVPAHIMNSFVGSVGQDKNIKLTSDGATVLVTTARNKTVINCVPHEDFPTIPEVSKEKSVEINAIEFVKGLKSVWYSSSVSSVKPELASVYVYQEDNSIVFAATDSFRLAEKKIRSKTQTEFKHVLIPHKNIAEIIKVLEEAGGIADMRLSDHQIAFSFGGTYITSRVVEGNFPDYRQIIPKEFKTEVIILKQDLLQAFKVATVFSDTFNQVGMMIDPAKKIFELTTKNVTVGENTSRLDATLTGEAITVNFNYRYITDCLQSIDADSISLSLAGPSRPVVVQGISDKSFTYIVMPMNR